MSSQVYDSKWDIPPKPEVPENSYIDILMKEPKNLWYVIFLQYFLGTILPRGTV